GPGGRTQGLTSLARRVRPDRWVSAESVIATWRARDVSPWVRPPGPAAIRARRKGSRQKNLQAKDYQSGSWAKKRTAAKIVKLSKTDERKTADFTGNRLTQT